MRPEADTGMEASGGEFDVEPSEAEDALERTVLHQDLEIRVETFDEESFASNALEPREVGHTVDEFLCSRCRLWKNRAQLVEKKRVICRDCAQG